MNIIEKLGLSLPLLQAPLVAYPHQAKFVSQVCNQGALGVYSTEFQSLDAIKDDIKSIKQQTPSAFAVMINLSESDSSIDLADRSSSNSYLKEAYNELDIKGNESSAFPSVNDICKAVVTERPPVIIFQNGLPTDEFIKHCHRVGITMFAIASNTLEAIAINSTQIHGIILQGNESAGILSKFENDLPVRRYPTNTLLIQTQKEVNKPLILWGDRQTASEVKSSINDQVAAVVVDTPLWTTTESPLPQSYKQALKEHNEMLTAVSTVWNGQPANVLQNKITHKQKQSKQKSLPIEKQRRFIFPIINAAIEQDNSDYMPLWAGLISHYSGVSIIELFQAYK